MLILYLQWCFFLNQIFLGKCHVNIKDPSVSDCEFHLLLKTKTNYKVALDLKWNKTWSYLYSGTRTPEHKHTIIFFHKYICNISPKILSWELPWKKFKEISLLLLLKPIKPEEKLEISNNFIEIKGIFHFTKYPEKHLTFLFVWKRNVVYLFFWIFFLEKIQITNILCVF